MARTFQQAEKKQQHTSMVWGAVPQLPLAYDCVIYPRISTPGQRGNVSSELQLKEDGELWNLALNCGWIEKQIRFPKDDMELSGRLRMEDRPAFKLMRSEEHTSELQSPCNLVCRLLLEKKKIQ